MTHTELHDPIFDAPQILNALWHPKLLLVSESICKAPPSSLCSLPSLPPLIQLLTKIVMEHFGTHGDSLDLGPVEDRYSASQLYLFQI